MNNSKILFSGIFFLLASCVGKPSKELSLGKWRGEFRIPGNVIPFNFSVEDDTAGLFKVYLTNGEERAALDSVYYKGDSVAIPVDVYDALLIGKIQGDSMKGFFRKNQSKNQGIPFFAKAHTASRFQATDTLNVPAVAGTYSAKLISKKEKASDTTNVVLILEQDNRKLTGTILTTTGDYRYFEGTTDNKTIRLSGFSGSNPVLLTVTLADSGKISGELIGPRGSTSVVAIKDPKAALPDPYVLTYLKKGNDKLAFTFPDLHGKPVSISDEKYKGKVVVVTIMGSWCPNCVDEAAYLSPWYDKNKTKGIEIIGLSFERKDDLAFARKRIEKFIKRFDIHYDILFAGLADKKLASGKLPQINAVLSFPTTFLIDRQGRVRKIHTGFTGPATGKYYDDFITEFNHDIETLLNEPGEAIALKK